jgi:hypothetical protein
LSHLSILPTVLRDADRLAAVLTSLGLRPRFGGSLEPFGEDGLAVVLQVQLADGQEIGWQRQRDGSLGLVCDLQRLSRSRSLTPLIGRITRAYAACQAISEASARFPTAQIEIRA